MTETVRNVSEIKAILANNTTGDISPTDIRDMFVTTKPDHGEIYISSAAATSFSDTTTWVPAAGTWTLTPLLNDNWEMDTNGQLRLDVPSGVNRACHIAASMSMTSSSNNQVVELAIAKNGTVITPSIVSRKIGTGSDVGSTALHAFSQLTLNDYLTVVIRNTSWTSAETVTLEYCNLFSMGMAT